jgi:ParB-like chromosome segregation protein Spo0J
MTRKKSRERSTRVPASPVQDAILADRRPVPSIPSPEGYSESVLAAGGAGGPPIVQSNDGHHVERDTIVFLDPRDLHPHPNNPRVDFGDADMEELEKQIRSNGNLNPVVFYTASDGKKYLIAGHRRRLAAIRAGVRIKATEVFVDEVEALALLVVENLHRLGFSEYEKCQSALHLHHALTEKAQSGSGPGGSDTTCRGMARRLGVTHATVANWLKIARAITPAMLEDAGFCLGSRERAEESGRTSISDLTLRKMLRAADQNTPEDSVQLLRTFRSAKRPASQGPAEPEQAHEVTKSGGEVRSIRVRKAISKMQPVEAGALARDLGDVYIQAFKRARVSTPGVPDEPSGGYRLCALPLAPEILVGLPVEEIDRMVSMLSEHRKLLQAARRSSLRARSDALRFGDG